MGYEIVSCLDKGRRIYVPAFAKWSYNQWFHLLHHTRPFEKSDEGKCGIWVLTCELKGVGEWASFQTFDTNKADIGKVGNKFVDLFIISVSDEEGRAVRGYPLRVEKDSIKARVLLDVPWAFARP